MENPQGDGLRLAGQPNFVKVRDSAQIGKVGKPRPDKDLSSAVDSSLEIVEIALNVAAAIRDLSLFESKEYFARRGRVAPRLTFRFKTLTLIHIKHLHGRSAQIEFGRTQKICSYQQGCSTPSVL